MPVIDMVMDDVKLVRALNNFLQHQNVVGEFVDGPGVQAK